MRLKILLNKEGLVINWVSYAVGLHLVIKKILIFRIKTINHFSKLWKV